MALADERAIVFIEEDWSNGDENSQIPETPLFEWVESAVSKFAQGASALGQVRLGLVVTGWNACSTNSAGAGNRSRSWR
jgi:hypothetical protein